MKKLLIPLLLFVSTHAWSQNNLIWGKSVEATRDFTIKNKKVTDISEDSTAASKDANKLITERASKLYADLLRSIIGGGGAGIDSFRVYTNIICTWKLGVQTCTSLNAFVCYTRENFDSTKYIHYNCDGEVLDSFPKSGDIIDVQYPVTKHRDSTGVWIFGLDPSFVPGSGGDNDVDSLGGFPANNYVKKSDSSAIFKSKFSADTAFIHLWTALTGKQNTISLGSTGQYFRGDLSLATFPTIPAQFNPIQGTGMTITGTYPNITFSAAGGGGSQTLQQVLITGATLTQTNTINNGGFLQKSSNGKNQFDSVGIKPALYVPDSTWFDGTSITFGIGPSFTYRRFASLVSQKIGTIESNHGVGGARMYVEGLNSLHIGAIPYYSSAPYRWMILEWGVNDMQLGVTDTATYATAYLKYLDTAIARGWPLTKIVILTPSYIDSTVSAAATMSRQLAWQTCTKSIAARRSITNIIDVFTVELNRGKEQLLVDGIHPNDVGTSVGYVNPITKFLGDSVRTNGPGGDKTLLVNGKTEVQSLRIVANDSAANNAVPAMLDSLGNIVKGTRGTYIENGNNNTQPQGVSIDIQGNAYIGNVLTKTIAEKLQVNGTIKGNYLRVMGGSPSGMTGSGLELGYTSGFATVFGYNRTGGAGLPLKINEFGGQVTIGGYATGGNHALGTQGLQSSYGQFTGSMAGTTGAGVEIAKYGSAGYIMGYDRGAGSTLDMYYQLFGGKNIFNGLSINGSNTYQFNGSGYINSMYFGGYVTPTAKVHIQSGTNLVSSQPIKLSAPSVIITAASGTGTVVTLTFAAQTYAPFVNGSKITISGVTPSGYNGTYTVGTCTTTSVTMNNTATGSQTVAGTIAQVTVLDTPENGAIEYDGKSIYLTVNSTRYILSKTLTGTAAPATIPVSIGDRYIDTTNKKEYVATGTSSSSDWTILN